MYNKAVDIGRNRKAILQPHQEEQIRNCYKDSRNLMEVQNKMEKIGGNIGTEKQRNIRTCCEIRRATSVGFSGTLTYLSSC